MMKDLKLKNERELQGIFSTRITKTMEKIRAQPDFMVGGRRWKT